MCNQNDIVKPLGYRYYQKDEIILSTFQPKTGVKLKKTYESINFLKKDEIFVIEECGLSSYPSVFNTTEADKIDDEEYCSIERLNFFEFGDYEFTNAVVRAIDLETLI